MKRSSKTVTVFHCKTLYYIRSPQRTEWTKLIALNQREMAPEGNSYRSPPFTVHKSRGWDYLLKDRKRETEMDWETRKWKGTTSHDINYWWFDVKQISVPRSRGCRSSMWAQRANPQSMWNAQHISVFRGLMFKSLLSGIRAWLSRRKPMFLLHTFTECSLDPCQNHTTQTHADTPRAVRKHFNQPYLHFWSSWF